MIKKYNPFNFRSYEEKYNPYGFDKIYPLFVRNSTPMSRFKIFIQDLNIERKSLQTNISKKFTKWFYFITIFLKSIF